MELTVVVCTLPERNRLLTRCLFYLEQQTNLNFDVLVMHGAKPKGDKLNKAFNWVETSHVMVCDDDDWVSPTLVEEVYRRAEEADWDFIGYDALQLANGQYTTTIYQEIASHICPTRTELARSVEFGNEYLADIKWTKQVARLVDTHTHIDRILYFYDKWNPPGEMTGWSPPREVGPWPHDKAKHFWG